LVRSEGLEPTSTSLSSLLYLAYDRVSWCIGQDLIPAYMGSIPLA
jgi:hypothetical protein